jgi:hypothetical protein
MKTRIPTILLIAVCVLGLGVLFLTTISASADSPQKVTSVELVSYDANPAFVTTELCIDLPSKAQWLPYAELSFGQTKLTNTSILLVDAKKPGILDQQNRCYILSFPLQENQVLQGQAMLTLQTLKADREGGLMTAAGVFATKKQLAQTHPGVEFTTFTESGTGGGGGGIKFTALPKGVTEDQAMAWVWEASEITSQADWSAKLDFSK